MKIFQGEGRLVPRRKEEAAGKRQEAQESLKEERAAKRQEAQESLKEERAAKRQGPRESLKEEFIKRSRLLARLTKKLQRL